MVPTFLAVAVQIAISPLLNPPLLRAAMDARYVYTCGVAGEGSSTKWTFGGGRLWLERTDLKEGSEITSLEYMIPAYGRRNALLRWQISDKKYYCLAYYGGHMGGGLDAEAVSRNGYMNAVPLTAIEQANANRKRRDFYRNHGPGFLELINNGPDLWPVLHATFGREDSTKKQVFFDFWCRGDKQYEVYVTAPQQGNRLTRHDFRSERQKPADQGEDVRWDKVGEWTFDWVGPFYVAAIGDDRYFVTETGRVFLAPRGAKPGTALKELWQGPPVDALIHDSDAKTWYAFTKDQFFEIADPIKPKPHTLSIRRAWVADDALKTAAECGRLIRSLPAPRISERTWDELASPEARVGHNAVWAMRNEPARAVALLKERLKPVQLPPVKELAALIDDLGAESFAKREAAQKRMREYGHTIQPLVHEVVVMIESAEARRRLNQLLTDWQRPDSLTPDELRASRAAQLLQRIGTPAATALLKAYATGAEAAILTREARKALR